MGILKDLLTLGGSYRVEKAMQRYYACTVSYERILGALNARQLEIGETIVRLKRAFSRTKRDLRRANKLITPLKAQQGCFIQSPHVSHKEEHSLTASPRSFAGAGPSQIIVGSAAIGTSAAILAWQGAQIVGVASTGTAMLGLHGAAASNAGWALFGGGSLATGGGGMALGHLVLPGIGAAVAVGIGAITTHMKANEINNSCVQVEKANIENEAALVRVDGALSKLRSSERTYEGADERLRSSIKFARLRLRRFGILTTIYRYIRFKLYGVYYTAEEQAIAENLESEVKAFFSAVGFQRTNQT